MKLSSLICVIVMLLSQLAGAQKRDSTGLIRAANALNVALVQKDEQTLNSILSKRLTYGHSNGWIERKQELIDNLHNGKLSYTAIKQTEATAAIDGKTGVVRSKGVFEVRLGAQDLSFKLSVLQVWVWKKGKWILMSRQSVKEEPVK